MRVETQIHLNKFKPRSWQLPVLSAIESGKYKRSVIVVHRRAGKDFLAFNYCIRELIKNPGMIIYYALPTFNQGRRVIWDARTHEGISFRSLIPQELIKRESTQEMKITLINDSILQVVGSNDYDNLRGTNPRGVVFSEYSRQDPAFYNDVIRPILKFNNGWAIFLSTPYGKNHFYELSQIAQNLDDWYYCLLSIEDTQLLDLSEIEKEREEGMSEDMIQQEYFCSFSAGVEGSYYAKYLDRMRLKGQIGDVPYETSFKVHTAWDIGVRDSTSIIFFQVIGQTVRIIDYYEKNKEGLEHFVKVLESKPYSYAKHIAPHDMAVLEFGSGLTRLAKAKQLGINFTIAPNIPIPDGIETVRSTFSKLWIDQKQCSQLIKSLENYRQEWDAKRKVYRSQPLHDWSSHAADAMRYLAVSLPKTRDGLSAQELDKRYEEARYGSHNANMPSIFRDDLPGL